MRYVKCIISKNSHIDKFAVGRIYEAKERILGHVIFSGGAYSMKGMTLAFEDSTFTDYINQVNDFRQIINNYKIY